MQTNNTERLWKGKGEDSKEGCCPCGAIDFWRVGKVYLITSSILAVLQLSVDRVVDCCLTSPALYIRQSFSLFTDTHTPYHFPQHLSSLSAAFHCVGFLLRRTNLKGHRNWVKSVPFTRILRVGLSLTFVTRIWGDGVYDNQCLSITNVLTML